MLRGCKKRVKRERNRRRRRGDEEDRISQLPDELIHHIVSLLGSKQGVATRMLSKKWKSLWNSIPVLIFGEVPHRAANDAKLLMNFIDLVLFNRDTCSTIEQFQFYCDEDCDSSRVYSWVTKLLRQNIQDLTLEFDAIHHSILFPLSLFTCQTLESLSILMDCELKLPTCIYLPKLKSLFLECVTFPDGYSTEQLVSNCPLLEVLYIVCCKWRNLDTLNICSPLLHLLYFSCSDDALINCQLLKIFTPNITTLHLATQLPNNFEICDMPSLDKVNITVSTNPRLIQDKIVSPHRLITMFLQPFSNVPHLTITGIFPQVMFIPDTLHFHLPTFKNLSDLSLIANDLSVDTITLLNFLHTTPNLQHLVLKKATYCYDHIHRSTVSTLPECLLLHLKTIEITEFGGDQSELDVVDFFLKNARALNKFSISFHIDSEMETRERVQKWFTMIPICSKNCIIDFI